MGVTNGRGVENITDCIVAAMFNCLPHASLTLVFFRVEGETKEFAFLVSRQSPCEISRLLISS